MKRAPVGCLERRRSNAERALGGPCRPGFSQSFYSVLISRDVLQGQGILKVLKFSTQAESSPLNREAVQQHRGRREKGPVESGVDKQSARIVN
ncbi:unnamed protein product [Pleuronectes platessa]|uniref:Cadherin prodomain domain-containing protein n=1 Tax=Pleuronectes platessa TaxID=8262 RepID=A0A9N7YKL7_PLEPL|nr:unnamed protein product [Pleuronectes platessa]